jgi:hypothetical protein
MRFMDYLSTLALPSSQLFADSQMLIYLHICNDAFC